MAGNWSGLGAAKPGWRRFLLLYLLGAVTWTLILRFYFPRYLDPFVPFHLDHLVYLGDSAEGYGFKRYIVNYPRPLGNALFDLIGRLGIRGMLVPVFLLALTNGTLLILYVERLTKQPTRLFTIAIYLVLVYGNPESYSSVKEDILAVVCLSLVLLIFNCWQNYLEAGKISNVYAIVLTALIGSYVKETYFVTLVVFFIIQAFVARRQRVMALALAAANVVIALISLAYNARFQVFVNPHAAKQNPYYQSWSLFTIPHGYHAILKWLVLPVPAALIAASMIVLFVKSRYRFYVGLVSLLLILTTLLPHAVLINHLEDQYAWLGAYFFFVPLLLVDGVLPQDTRLTVLLAIASLVFCRVSLHEYKKDLNGMAGWWRTQEIHEQHLFKDWPILQSTVKPGDRNLVLGLNVFNDPFRVPTFIMRTLPPRCTWTIVVPDSEETSTTGGIQFVHLQEFHPAEFDHAFVFSPDARLIKVYSGLELRSVVRAGQLPGWLAPS